MLAVVAESASGRRAEKAPPDELSGAGLGGASGPGHARLRSAYERYARAFAANADRAEAASARLALIAVLQETGWEAPEEVRGQMARDTKALRRLAESETSETSALWVPRLFALDL